jgi:hypothetical protein
VFYLFAVLNLGKNNMSLFRRFISEAGTFRTTKTTNNKTGKVSTKTTRMSKPKKAATTGTRRAKRK